MVAEEHPALKAAVVGCGPRGIEHAEALRAVDGVALAAVVDVSDAPREEASERFGVPEFAAIDRMLAETRPELVVVATPPPVRLDPVARCAAMESVSGIVVEKPMALSLAEAEEMVATCDSNRVLLTVGHQLRFAPSFVALREAVQSGQLGSVEFVRAAAFGDLLDQGPHLLDAMRWILGGPQVLWAMSQRGDGVMHRLAGMPQNGAGKWIPPWMTHYLAFQGGIRGALETGPLHQAGRQFVDEYLDERISIVASDGIGEASASGACRILSGSGGGWEVKDVGIDAYKGATVSLHRELRAAVLGERPHRTDAHDALATLEGVLACAQSAADGDAVALPLARDRNQVAELIDRRGPVSSAGPGGGEPAALGTTEPEVSVIVPLPDHRGHAPDCIRGWLAQTVARERFEIVVGADGREPELEAEIQALLGDRGRLVRVEGADEITLYDAGARAARGGQLLITEPHCIPERNCIEELLSYLSRTDYDGAVMRSTGITDNRLSQMEERLYDDSFVEWSRHDHWCKVILRGVGISRQAYLDVGGFDTRYGRFAEYVLAARLHATGRRLGYAPGAAVKHAYSRHFRGVEPAITDFATGEMAYRAEHSAEFCDRYFGTPPEWVGRADLDPKNARAASALALRTLASRSAWRGGSARASARALRRSLSPALFGARGRLLRAELAYWSARARCVIWRPNRSRLEPAYRQVWSRLVTRARLRYIARTPQPSASMPAGSRFSLAELPEDRMYGFHSIESVEGKSFRWSGPVAFMDLPVEAGAYRVHVNTLEIGESSPPSFFFNGRRVPDAAVQANADGLSFSVDAEWFSDRTDQRLALTCATMPPGSGDGTPERRELGVPAVAVEFAGERTP